MSYSPVDDSLTTTPTSEKNYLPIILGKILGTGKWTGQ
jgi:hypothetical protein